MNVFFVRHGESEDNAKDVFSSPETPLTEKGKKQAEAIRVQCHGIPADIILTTSYVRTKSTAELINETADREIVFIDDLRENKFPSELIGLSHGDKKAKDVLKKINEHAEDPTWHYSDEENFHEFSARVSKGLELLVGRGEENILVVTHSNVMRMIMAQVMLGDHVSPGIYRHLHHALTTKNTGITYMRHNRSEWELVTWNNYTHLDDVS